MKRIALILVCFVTALILQPAVSSLTHEEPACCEDACEKTEDEQELPQGFCTEKNCNPFAYCCYGIGYNVTASMDYTMPEGPVLKPLLSFKDRGSSAYFSKFWQPPQSC